MRFIFGIIVGCLLTVGVAYVHDAAQPDATVASADTASAEGRMVNWAVVDRNIHGVDGWVHAQLAWINSQFNHAG